jgi:hypothetical protein
MVLAWIATCSCGWCESAETRERLKDHIHEHQATAVAGSKHAIKVAVGHIDPPPQPPSSVR